MEFVQKVLSGEFNNQIMIVLGVLLAISEILGSSEKLKSSSVFQLVVSFLKKGKALVAPKA